MNDAMDRLARALEDRYAIERALGAGGMATVYLAEDLKHKRRVALKVLKPELAAVLGAERFVQEITTTASLQHPHILPLYDSGRTGGPADGRTDEFLFYTMPYVQGETLREKLDRETQLGVEEAVRIACEVADALDYAHRQGVIHRDIKPENILLQDGRALVADFGIALAVSAAAGGRMTETGLSLGTPHYMSPEQATADRDISARSDVYSLASVLYEMLTGDPPHTASSAQAIIMKIVTDTARPVTELRKSVPPHVAAATAKALEKLPADRFASAAEFGAALQNPAFATVAMGGIAARPSVRRSVLVPVLAATTVLLAVLSGWALTRPAPQAPARPIRFTIEPDSLHSILFDGIAISPDGSVIVYAGDRNAGNSSWIDTDATDRILYARRLSELVAQPIPGTEGGARPFFSPDGSQLGFVTDRTLRRVPMGGGTARTVAAYRGTLVAAVWTETDEIVFATWGPFQVARVPANGGTPRLLQLPADPLDGAPLVDGAMQAGLSHLHAVAGTRSLFLTSTGPSGSSSGMHVYWLSSLDDGTLRSVVPGLAAWFVPPDRLVWVTAEGTLVTQPVDPTTFDTIGVRTPLDDGFVQFPWMTAVSSSGVVAYPKTDQTGSELVMVDRTGTERRLLGDRQFWLPRFSPDGSRLVFGELDADEDLWIYDPAAGTTARVTLDGLGNNDPVWSPDGRRLAFSRDLVLKDLYITAARGTQVEPDTALVMDGIQWTTDWSPDGRFLVFTNFVGNDQSIWVLPLDGERAPRPFFDTPFLEGAARVSPDGRWLAYHSDESGRYEVYVQSFPEAGNKRLISTDGGRTPIWGPDGRELFYRRDAELMVSRVTLGDDVTVDGTEVLLRLPAWVTADMAQYDVHPDGQRFVMVRGQIESRVVVTLDLVR